MTVPVFLFDIDGVLVEPHGYRQSIRLTLNHFTSRMGLGDLCPDEADISLFESQGVTSEWDIVPICLAAILDALQGNHPELRFPPDLLLACEVVRAGHAQNPVVDYQSLALKLGTSFKPGVIPSKLALMLNETGRTQPPFPHLVGHPLLAHLLDQTRNIYTSLVTRTFQHYSLGSDRFEQTYGSSTQTHSLAPEFETISYLKTCDRPILTRKWRDTLISQWKAGCLHLAAYTARPSLVKNLGNNREMTYSPEAEMALELTGLEGIPLVGYGQVCALAELTGLSPEQIIKPSPIQPLGAIGAALYRDEMSAMLAAERLINGDEAMYFKDMPALDIHIFEDSAGSIRAVEKAASLLAEHGVPITVHAWGVATDPSKVTALQKVGAAILADVNQALVEAYRYSVKLKC